MLAVIGDIHGCYYTFLDLYNAVKSKYPNIPIYCIGDFVDRGLHSYKVMNFVESERIKFTPGNHDYMFYYFFKEPTSVFARSWVFNGNETTLESYENHQDAIPRHLKMIVEAPLFYDLDDCFISHAGVSSFYKRFLPENYKEDLSPLYSLIEADYVTDRGVLWTRDELLNLGKLQIVGHTHQKEVTYVEESNALYIDTGACVGNKLSAVVIEKGEIIDTIQEPTHIEDIIV
jgi:serine/threonine protein phosphatase 1